MWASAALVVLVIAGLGLAYANLDRNIERVDLDAAVGTDRPTAAVEGPLNILVMGSDTREGVGNDQFGGGNEPGEAQSDTNMLVHLSADRSRAMVVSIPRDSMVRAPENCADLNSTVADGVVRQWNLNFNEGGPACVVRTLEGNTDIRIDHFVVVDFSGFQQMVDALGGVEVCLPQDVSDRRAHFEKEAGRHLLTGEEALGYVRLRHGLGDGSDLGRIERQQAFMSSVAQKATSTRLLLRPDRLYAFLDAATESITTDRELGTTSLARIANSVRAIGLDQVEFVTVPVEEYPDDPNRVQWTAEADLLWASIRNDVPLTEEVEDTETDEPTPTATEEPELVVSPDEISVSVVNATGLSGLARQVASALAVQGFVAMPGGNLPIGEVEGAVITHSADQAEAARTVQAAFPGSVLANDESLGELIVVQLGPGAADPVEVPNRLGTEPLPEMTVSAEDITVESPTGTPTIPVRTADEDICD